MVGARQGADESCAGRQLAGEANTILGGTWKLLVLVKGEKSGVFDPQRLVTQSNVGAVMWELQACCWRVLLLVHHVLTRVSCTQQVRKRMFGD